jgi:hypothetical protein
MDKQFPGFAPRSFKPMPIPGVSNKAREAINDALDAFSTWRNEAASASEKNCTEVVEKMAAAAKALGWPEQVVDTIRSQIQSLTEMQIKTMDQVMDVWEEQLKLPDPSAAPWSGMLSKLKSPGSGWPGAGGFDPMNPMQAWMQFVEQWQKNWQETMANWVKIGKPQ